MDYLSYPQSYIQKQIERVESVRAKICSRETISSDGRVIPFSGDMPIGTGRRLDASVLFLDISGFSSRASENETDQDNLLRMLTLFFGEMIKITENYDGVVEKNTGDGLMAYFVDDSSATSALKAVSCALTMFATNTHLINPIIERSGFQKINFRIGIDSGKVLIAEVGAARGFKGILAIGTTANIACKMLAKADPEELLVGENTIYKLPDDWVEKWVKLKSDDTGWVYSKINAPYRFFKYTGRWVVR